MVRCAVARQVVEPLLWLPRRAITNQKIEALNQLQVEAIELAYRGPVAGPGHGPSAPAEPRGAPPSAAAGQGAAGSNRDSHGCRAGSGTVHVEDDVVPLMRHPGNRTIDGLHYNSDVQRAILEIVFARFCGGGGGGGGGGEARRGESTGAASPPSAAHTPGTLATASR